MTQATQSRQNVFKNFAFLTGARLLGDIFVFLFFIVLARSYGQEGLGHYSFAMAITSLLVVLADFGIYNFSIKEMSRSEDAISDYYSRLLAIRLLLVATTLVVLLVGTMLLSFSYEMTAIVLLIGAYNVILTLVDGFGAVYLARGAAHITSLLEFSLRVTTALAGMVVMLMGKDILMAIAALPIMTLFFAVIGYFYTRHRLQVQPRLMPMADVLKVLKNAAPYAQRSLLALLSTRVALIFIGFMIGEAAAGVFNAAYRVVFVLLFLPAFAGMSVFPMASQLFVDSPSSFRDLYRSTLGVVLVLGIPMAAGIWLIAPNLIDILYTSAFVPSVDVLRWLAWLILAAFVRSVSEIFLMASDRQVIVTRAYLLTAVVGGALHYWLIAHFGVKGAAIATLLAEVLLVILLGRHLSALLLWRTIGVRVLLSAVATAGFLIPLLAIKRMPLGATVAVAMLIYAGIMLLFEEIRQNELKTVRSYISNLKAIRTRMGDAS